MTEWDGRRDTPHTIQDERELAEANGWTTWTFDEAGDMTEADDDCPWCGESMPASRMAWHVRRHVGGVSRSGYNPRPDEDPVYRREMKDAGRGRMLR